MWLLFQLDVILFSFLLLSSSSVFQSAAVSGGRNSISPPSPSPVRYALCSLCGSSVGLTQQVSIRSFLIIFKFAFAAHGWTVFLVLLIPRFIRLSIKFLSVKQNYIVKILDTFLNTMHNMWFCTSMA